MIPPSTILEIQRLLKKKHYGRRKIAKRLRVSLGTVVAVATGVRQVKDYLDHPLEREPAKETRRCPSCGALVNMPCMLCQTREMLAGHQLPPLEPRVDTPIGLNLKPEHQAGYAEVRRWRREALRLGVITKPHYDSDPS